MANKETIQFSATGLKSLQKDVRKLERQLKKLDKSYKENAKSSKGAGRSMAGLAVKLGLGYMAFRTLQRGIAGVISVGADFEKQMSKVAAISGATGYELLKLEQSAKDLGKTTVFTASEVAGLQVEFAKLGFTTAEINKVTKGTLALAAATGSDLARAAEVAGATLRGFGLEAGETGRVSDVMAKSFSRSALDMERFAESMKFVAPVAKSAGFSIEETTAILAKMADVGIHGSMAGTSLKNIFSALAKEGTALSEAFGGPVTSLEELQEKMLELKASGFGLSEALDLVDRRAAPAFLALVDGAEDLSVLKTAFDNANGTAQNMADVMLDNFSGSVTRLKSATEGLGIALFESFGEPLRKIVEGITSVVSAITSWIEIPLSDKIREEKKEFNFLVSVLKDVNALESSRALAIDELNAKYGIYIGNIDLESASINQLRQMQDAANKSFMESINLAAASEVLREEKEKVIELEIEIFREEQRIFDQRQKMLGDGLTLMEHNWQQTQIGLLGVEETQKLEETHLNKLKKNVKEAGIEYEELAAHLIKTGYEVDIATGTIIDFSSEVNKGEQATAGFKTHIVETGDTLSVLAERFGVSIEDLMEWNNLTSTAIGLGATLIVGIEKTTAVIKEKTKAVLTDAEAKILWLAAHADALVQQEQEATWIAELIKNNEELARSYGYVGDAIGVNMTVEELYQAQKLLQISEQRQAMIDLGVSNVEIAKWELQQIEQIEALKSSAKAQSVSQLTGSLGQLNQATKGSAETSKKLAQVTALIDTYAAANKALAASPPPWNFIAAAAVVAAGLANVKQIESQSFARGGLVGGQGSGDTVPAMLTPGEFVLSKSAVTDIGLSTATSINEGGGASITINISAPLVDETVRDSIIPAIQKAQRMGLA